MPYFINGTPQLEQIIAVSKACAYQINGKTVAIFSAIYTVRSSRTIFVNRGFVRVFCRCLLIVGLLECSADVCSSWVC